MNKAKRARWCNPLEGVQRKGITILGTTTSGEGGGGGEARAGGEAPVVSQYYTERTFEGNSL